MRTSFLQHQAARVLAVSLLFVSGTSMAMTAQDASPSSAVWISTPSGSPCPTNSFTYFRREVNLASLPADPTLHVAADSNAHVWINGTIVRRKVTRYAEPLITTETIDARGLLHVGVNTVVILNHSWGPIVAFQRTGCKHAGVFVASSWVSSDARWKVRHADEFAANEKQIVGVSARTDGAGDHRIRFAQFVNGALIPPAFAFTKDFDESKWTNAEVVTDGPWPAHPLPSGTPGQRERPVLPRLLLAQGTVIEPHVERNDPVAIGSAILHGEYHPFGAQAMVRPFGEETHAIEVRGHAGETRYITFDFGRPVHGYPFLSATAQGTAPTIDFAYGELNRSPLTGKFLVDTNGWINPEAIVGKGYIDRYYATAGAQHVEFPEERTARWLTVHLYFPKDGVFRVRQAGFISSQYPTDVKGSFHSGAKRLDAVVRLSLEHAIVSMSDTYVDTPGREDGMWLEDARLRAQLAAQWFGDVRLRQLFLRLASESQTADGHLHPFPPSNYPILSNADWSAEWVGALYDDYLWTGETSRMVLYWPKVVKWWDLVLSKVDGTGLWRDSNVFADIRIGSHAAQGQSSGIASAQIIQRLTLSIAMAEAIGDHDHAVAWTKMHDRMLAAFRRDHLVPGSGKVPLHVDDVAAPGRTDVTRGYSQAAQAMAIEGGLLTPEEAASDLDYSFSAPDGNPTDKVDRWNNPTYLYRSLNALTLAGDANRAVRHLLERFAPYLPGDPRNLNPVILQGPWGGPLPEYWVSREDLGLQDGTPNPAQPLDPTGSHGWNSVALVWLHDSLLGVRISQPGGSLLQIKPQSGGLKLVEGTTMTPKGAVFVSWKPQARRLAIRLPVGSSAVITLPAELAPADRSRNLHIPVSCSRTQEGNYQCSGRVLTFRAD
ncbi:alpha-L-rhamnosidase C-terminal domain-containing protein [Terriglobus roseus]|uniref:Alpha-L-rhamnosidase n=1 Tax=Terriglobus roseus TaxID=392734 RepID=A0A1H4J693_9BACT|nr:alpha-L-rhamnosidase C-terminal domain-containing protein [Terriglobus roseus]SEB41741.1 alpha-L-rhamnosidase [Terriglobus roseus]